MNFSRRSLLAGLSAICFWRRRADAGSFALVQAANAPFALQPIDGGPTYYADNGFTYAATAADTFGSASIWNGCTGWDDYHFFPIGSWLDTIAVQADADAWHDIGFNTNYGVNASTVATLAKSNFIWLIQLTGDFRDPTHTGPLANTNTETVGFTSFDEPFNWAETYGGVSGLPSQNITASITFPAGGQLNVTSSTGTTLIRGGPASVSSITGQGLLGVCANQANLFNGNIGGFVSGTGGNGSYVIYNILQISGTVPIPVSTQSVTVNIGTTNASAVVIGNTVIVDDGAGHSMSGPITAYTNNSTGPLTFTATPIGGAGGNATNPFIEFPVSSETMTVPAYPANLNSFTDKRFWYVNFTNQQIGSAPRNTPSSSMNLIKSWQVPTPAGVGRWASRTIDMVSFDWYPMSAGSSTVGQNPAATNASIYQLFNTGTTTTSLTIGVPPYTTSSITVVNPSSLQYDVGGTITLDAGSGNTISGTVATSNLAGIITVHATSVTGSGTFASWNITYYMPQSQMQRATHYGNQVDMFRSFYAPLQAGAMPNNAGSAPSFTFIDASCAWSSSEVGSLWVTPWQLSAMTWSTIMHRARMVVYFGQYIGGGQGAVSGGAWFGSWGKAVQSGNTISQYDQQRAICNLVRTLAPVINSPFAVANPTPPASVSSAGGPGFTLPYAPFTYPGTPSTCNFNNDLKSVFEIAVHYYNHPTETFNGVTLTQNKYWVWCMYRGYVADTNITATIQLSAPLASSSVTRIYADGVLGVTTGSSVTTIQVGDTSWIAPGDTVTIVNTTTTGVTLNGTYTVNTVPSLTTFTVLLNSTGMALTKNGVAICQHTINTTNNGAQFQDTFPYGTSVGIYRVN